jgi:hypothetical protein
MLTISSKLVDKTNFVENLPEGRCASWRCSPWWGVLAQLIDGALASAFGLEGAWRGAMYLAIVTVVGAVAAWRLTQSRQRRRAMAALTAGQPVPEPVGA